MKPGTPLADTAFSLPRLFVWGIGIYMILGGVGMIVLAMLDKEIPMQLATTTAVCVGAFVARIEKRK